MGLPAWFCVALGGALGALARYWLVGTVGRLVPGLFPWGVLVTNVLGCFIAGVVFVVTSGRPGLDPAVRLLLAVGFLGAFTTFSAFSVDTLALLQAGALPAAVLNVVGNLLPCLIACALGMSLARQW
jgi:CrcB protein